MIDPPPLIGPATPLRRVERTLRDQDPGRKQGGHGQEPKPKDEQEPGEEGEGLHVDVRV